MKSFMDSGFGEGVFLYSVIYTVATILNSVLYLAQGVRNDPSGNWHELTRAVIVLIGVTAYEMGKRLPIRNLLLRLVVTYIPTMALAFGFVWLNQFIEPLAASAYRDIFVNYTGLFVIVSAVVLIREGWKKRREKKES